MKAGRRTAAVAALVLLVAATGCTPLGPGVPVLTSPHNGSSAKDAFSDVQFANVQFCSPDGGLVEVTVNFANADLNTTLGVNGGVMRDGEPVFLFQVGLETGVTAVNEFTSEVPLEPGECTTLRLASSQYFNKPGRPFTFTVSW